MVLFVCLFKLYKLKLYRNILRHGLCCYFLTTLNKDVADVAFISWKYRYRKKCSLFDQWLQYIGRSSHSKSVWVNAVFEAAGPWRPPRIPRTTHAVYATHIALPGRRWRRLRHNAECPNCGIPNAWNAECPECKMPGMLNRPECRILGMTNVRPECQMQPNAESPEITITL